MKEKTKSQKRRTFVPFSYVSITSLLCPHPGPAKPFSAGEAYGGASLFWWAYGHPMPLCAIYRLV